MKYVVIDTDGKLHRKEVSADRLGIIRQEVGAEGFAIVRVRTGPWADQLAGFVNDVGLTKPDLYPRNVIGSCLLAALGANQQPYAGHVVITGWHNRSGDLEVCDLSEDLTDVVQQVHVNIRIALGHLTSPVAIPTRWAAEMAEFAAYVADGPTPEMRITADPAEVEAILREATR